MQLQGAEAVAAGSLQPPTGGLPQGVPAASNEGVRSARSRDVQWSQKGDPLSSYDYRVLCKVGPESI